MNKLIEDKMFKAINSIKFELIAFENNYFIEDWSQELKEYFNELKSQGVSVKELMIDTKEAFIDEYNSRVER